MKPFNAHFKEYLSDEEEEEEVRKQPKEKFGHSRGNLSISPNSTILQNVPA